MEEKNKVKESQTSKKFPNLDNHRVFANKVRELTSLYPSGILLRFGNTEEWKPLSLKERKGFNPQASELIFTNLFTTIF